MDNASQAPTTPSRPIVEVANGLALREWQQKDIASSTHHLNNKNVLANMRNRIPNPYTEADAASWITFCQDPANHVRSGNWTAEGGSEGPAVSPSFAITFNDVVVGGIGLDFKEDVYFRTAEIGYWLGEEFWGQYVMSRVVPPFMGWAWQTFGILVRVSGETYDANTASGKVLQKGGFKYEGRRPDMVCKNGVIGATLMWGALRPRIMSAMA
ncbi:hypothetical protein LTR10_008961 [Elasticomyces elasticus]|nr:hypothetical protein LTR10_008961 [Elasticomyces elasticus]KAK4964809.1 hypothetical protein LTR42_012756 [Elasticomyces elasticus]